MGAPVPSASQGFCLQFRGGLALLGGLLFPAVMSFEDGGRTKGTRKRKADNDAMDDDDETKALSPTGKARGKQLGVENALDFEDPFEDEFDEDDGDEDVVMAEDEDDEQAMDVAQPLEDEEEGETQVRCELAKIARFPEKNGFP